jgi:hypothetical protein
VAKPTEVLIWLVAGLYAVRISFRYQHPFKEAVRAGLRLLQVIHIPLATVLLAASAVHSYLYIRYLWRSDFHYWSGVTGLVTTGLVVVHIFL